MRRRRSVLRRLAVVLAPALVVALGWAWFSAVPLREALAATRRQHVDVARDVPDARMLEQAQARVAVLRAAVAAATAARPAVPSTAPAATVPASSRARWRLQLSEVLAAHRLRLLGEERLDVELPAAVAKALGGESGTRWPAWSLRLAGTYPDVVAAIAALQSAALPCHVLDLEMKRDAAGQLAWTLVVG